MRRAAALLFVLAVLAAAGSARAAAPEWRSQQPLSSTGRAPLGEVGDLECWQANRCLLITSGNNGMPAGLYAYDGAGWYLYSTVCGGHDGRIAWAGPDDFWTISDQQAGQETEFTQLLRRRSLCHFKDGAVVASYAEPLGVASSYFPMSAAACLGPEECWFAGERLPGTVNVGAFHLYWNGLSVSPFPSLSESQPELEDPGRSVVGLAYHEGSLYESVKVQEGDEAPDESESEPSFLHKIVPGGPPAFVPEATASPIFYGEEATPNQLEGFQLSDDGEALWAVSGAASAPAEVAVLRLGAGASSFEQVPLSDATSPFGPGDKVTGLAGEPGSDAAWVGFRPPSDIGTFPARLALVHADGTVDPPLALPAEGEGVGRYWGSAGPIACPAAGQCWMATQKGWLFHLGPDPTPNEDPAMHTLVTFRPPDAGLPSVPPTSLPEDDSGANSSSQGEEAPLGVQEERPPHRRPPLVRKLKQRLLGGTTLELTFILRAKAHVRLLAKRKGDVVAKTKDYTMAKGHRRLRLRLDPKRWPTKLDLQVHAVKDRSK
jgi:hypothetical protein